MVEGPLGSVLGLRPTGLEFQILRLEEGSVILLNISVWPICAQMWPFIIYSYTVRQNVPYDIMDMGHVHPGRIYPSPIVNMHLVGEYSRQVDMPHSIPLIRIPSNELLTFSLPYMTEISVVIRQ